MSDCTECDEPLDDKHLCPEAAALLAEYEALAETSPIYVLSGAFVEVIRADRVEPWDGEVA